MGHNLATAEYLATKYVDTFRSDNPVIMREFQQTIRQELNVNLKKWKGYNINGKAIEKIGVNFISQYKLIHNYVMEIEKKNSGSNIQIQSVICSHEGDARFRRLYVRLEALKRGFKEGCSKIIGTDGTFLKGPHQGVFLTAVGVDANNGMYPIVYAIAENENKNSWLWFINYLNHDLEIVNPAERVIMSDRQKVLIEAVSTILPGTEHIFFCRHLHNNMRKEHSGEEINELFWKCAKATYINQYTTKMSKLGAIDMGAVDWLRNNTEHIHWSRSHFRVTNKCDMLLNNHTEAFNKQLLIARTKPILGILERIRVYLMVRVQEKREWMTKLRGDTCPSIMRIVEKIKEDSILCSTTYCGDSKFEVLEANLDKFAVDTEKRTCTCRKWDISGIPCTHGVAALGFLGLKAEDFVNECYIVAAYKRAYTPVINHACGPNN